MLKEKLRKEIKTILKKEKKTQAELGLLINMSRTHVSNALNGSERKGVSVAKYLQMLDSLGYGLEINIYKRNSR